MTIHEAKTHLSRLIAAVERGEEVVIAHRDKPVVRLVMERPAKPKRRLRFMLKPGQEPPNFDGFFDKKLDEEIERDFYDVVEADIQRHSRSMIFYPAMDGGTGVGKPEFKLRPYRRLPLTASLCLY